MKKNKAKKQICSNQNLQSFIIGHHDLLHGSCLFFNDHNLQEMNSVVSNPRAQSNIKN